MVRNKLNIFAMLNSCPNFIAGIGLNILNLVLQYSKLDHIQLFVCLGP